MHFLDFARYEVLCGGPDPHLKLAVHLAQDTPCPAWFIGLYTIPYNIPSAEVLFHHLPEPTTISELQAEELWSSIVVRKERRVNGFGPKKLAETINAYHDWILDRSNQPFKDFDEFRSSLKNYGRYFGMKLYEALRRAGEIDVPMFTDIQPKDGKLSRKGLTLIFPEHDYKAKDQFACLEANELANELVEMCNESEMFAETIDWFTIEVLLCEYRQAVRGGQYPGRAHDSELDHYRTVSAKNPEVQFRMLEARRQLFPHWALGELQGWEGRRPLGTVMNQYGYVWSDKIYSYLRTTDFSQPVPFRSQEQEEEFEALAI